MDFEFDLIIRGVGLFLFRENLVISLLIILIDVIYFVFNMLFFFFLMYEEDYFWVEISNDFVDCFELDDNNNNSIW